MVEAQRHLVLANRDDRRLLDISSDEDDRPVADLGIEGTLGRVLTSGNRAEDELHLAGERLMVVNQMPCGTIADERRRPALCSCCATTRRWPVSPTSSVPCAVSPIHCGLRPTRRQPAPHVVTLV